MDKVCRLSRLVVDDLGLHQILADRLTALDQEKDLYANTDNKTEEDEQNTHEEEWSRLTPVASSNHIHRHDGITRYDGEHTKKSIDDRAQQSLPQVRQSHRTTSCIEYCMLALLYGLKLSDIFPWAPKGEAKGNRLKV